jgi:hypothetical protein
MEESTTIEESTVRYTVMPEFDSEEGEEESYD